MQDSVGWPTPFGVRGAPGAPLFRPLRWPDEIEPLQALVALCHPVRAARPDLLLGAQPSGPRTTRTSRAGVRARRCFGSGGSKCSRSWVLQLSLGSEPEDANLGQPPGGGIVGASIKPRVRARGCELVAVV